MKRETIGRVRMCVCVGTMVAEEGMFLNFGDRQ